MIEGLNFASFTRSFHKGHHQKLFWDQSVVFCGVWVTSILNLFDNLCKLVCVITITVYHRFHVGSDHWSSGGTKPPQVLSFLCTHPVEVWVLSLLGLFILFDPSCLFGVASVYGDSFFIETEWGQKGLLLLLPLVIKYRLVSLYSH